jgi:hypothetical protein
MATAAEVASLRANTGQSDTDVYEDPELAAIIDTAGSVEAASAVVWRQLASHYAKLTDTQEAGASHKYSLLYDRAMEQADFWEGRALNGAPIAKRGAPRTITITRV